MIYPFLITSWIGIGIGENRILSRLSSFLHCLWGKMNEVLTFMYMIYNKMIEIYCPLLVIVQSFDKTRSGKLKLDDFISLCIFVQSARSVKQ